MKYWTFSYILENTLHDIIDIISHDLGVRILFCDLQIIKMPNKAEGKILTSTDNWVKSLY